MIQITIHGEIIQRLDQLPARLHSAIESKMRAILDVVYAKAVQQFSAGKYSATDEVAHGIERQGDLVIGYIEPLTLKARIQETGGDHWYEIVPVKARLLKFIGKDGARVFAAHVWHPPTPGKHYVAQTILENREWIESEIEAAIVEGFA